MFKFVVFDIDNTLYDHTYSHTIAINSVFNMIYQAEKSEEIERKLIKSTYDNVVKELKIDILQTGSSHSRIIYFKNLINQLNLTMDPLELNTLYWTVFYQNIKLFDGTMELLELLKSFDIKLGIITNFTLEHQLEKLKKLEIDRFFDHILTGEETLIEKPNPLMFLKMLNKFNCLPSESLMIGDSYINDILPAEKLGINTIHINNQSKPILDKLSMSMLELYTFFDNISKELNKFSVLSRRIGERFDLVQAGGGNVSFKYNDLMFIKSSGINISEIDLFNGYSIINNKKLLNDGIFNCSMQEYSILKTKKASIETYMHSFMKKYTIHIHPIETNTHLVRKNIYTLRKKFPTALFIEYKTPGKPLAEAIFKEYDDHELIFLRNHGIIITSDDSEDLLDIINDIVEKCDDKLYEKYQPVNKISSVMESVYNTPFCTSLVEDQLIEDLLGFDRPISTFPDKPVYCGHVFYNQELTKENLIQFSKKNKEIPKIIRYQSNIYICSKSLKMCKDIEGVLKSHLIITEQADINELDTKEVHFLMNWDEEKFRMQ
jgi:FMN phosphatase YigB (HAD superfamily)/ribulose-5-phosphate 4-epimerase/fuculose-1-phosphate aldolase